MVSTRPWASTSCSGTYEERGMLPRAGRYRSVKISEPLERVTLVFLLPSEEGEVDVICVEVSLIQTAKQ